MDLVITILPVVTKDLSISPWFTPYDFLSRCRFSNLTTHQPMVELYLLTFPRFPLRKKEHKSYFGKNRTHDFRTSRCAAYLLDHSGVAPIEQGISCFEHLVAQRDVCCGAVRLSENPKMSREHESSSPGERVQKRRRRWPVKCCVSNEQTRSTTLQVSHTVSLTWINYPETRSASALGTAVLYGYL